MSAPSTENRKFPRIQTHQVTRLRASTRDASGEAQEGDIANISTGGVFIATPDPLPMETVVEFDMRLPTLPSAISVTAVVRWHQEEKEPRGMGVEFLEISESDLNALCVYLDAYQSEAEGM